MTPEEFDALTQKYGLRSVQTNTEIRVKTRKDGFVCAISQKMLEHITVEDFSAHYLKLPNELKSEL